MACRTHMISVTPFHVKNCCRVVVKMSVGIISHIPLCTYNRKGTLDRLALGEGGAGDERPRLEEEELRLVSTMVLVSDPKTNSEAALWTSMVGNKKE
jgi:hypothetical protein